MNTFEQTAEHKTFGKPDEVREFPNGRAEILDVDGVEVGRLIFQPGWRWSTDVQPLAKTARKPDQRHPARPGDVTSLPKGHDAWVIGDEPVVVVDWFGATNYAKRN